jgi:hypothetical protein
MRRRRLLLRGAVFFLGLSAVLFAVAQFRERDDPARTPPPPVVAPREWGYGSSRLSAPAYMRFADDRLGDKVRRFHGFAAQSDGPESYHQPFLRRPNHPGTFSLEAGSFRDAANQGTLNYHGPRKARCMLIVAYFDPNEAFGKETVVGIHVHARWKPAGAGWAAELRYTTYHGRVPPWAPDARELFELHFQRYTDAGLDPAPRITLRRDGGMSYTTQLEAADPPGRTVYRIGVLTYDPDRKASDPPDGDVLRILASPESLRDYGLKCCDYLAGKVEDDFASGEAVREAIRQPPPEQVQASPRDAGPPADRTPSARRLTDDEKRRALEDARKQVRAQASVLAKDYRELHAAVLKACPIADFVRPADPE